MTVPELLARTTSRELTEWMIYEQMEPFGERGAYLRSGIVAAASACSVVIDIDSPLWATVLDLTLRPNHSHPPLPDCSDNGARMQMFPHLDEREDG